MPNQKNSFDENPSRGKEAIGRSGEDLREKYGSIEPEPSSEWAAEPPSNLNQELAQTIEEIFDDSYRATTPQGPSEGLPSFEENFGSDEAFLETFFTETKDEPAVESPEQADPPSLTDESLQNPSGDIHFTAKATGTPQALSPAPEIKASSPDSPAFDDKELSELFGDLNEDRTKEKQGLARRFVKNAFPAKGDGFLESLRKTVLSLSVVTMLVCVVFLLNLYLITPYLAGLEAKKIADLSPTVGTTQDSDGDIKQKYPGVNFPEGMQYKHAGLYAINRDFVAWLKIPGIDIDMPVVKGRNNSEYLKKTFYNERSKYGCAFLDYRSSVKDFDRNSVIYGHNMSYDDLMFGPLLTYQKPEGFKNAPIIEFSTLYKDTKWKIYAVFLTNGSSKGDNGYLFNYIFQNLSSDEAFMGFVDEIDQRKFYSTGVDIKPGDKILTLSTCFHDHFKNGRLVVVARLVREGEGQEIDFSKVSLNPSPRYPQAWYSAKGLKNPYKNAKAWYPN